MNSNNNKIIESFINVPLTPVVQMGAINKNGEGKAVFNQDQIRLSNLNMYQVPPSLKSNLPPRFSSMNGYGPYLRSSMPNERVLAVPKDPMNRNVENFNIPTNFMIQPGSQKKVKEEYEHKPMTDIVKDGMVEGTQNNKKNKNENSHVYNVTSDLPIQDMTAVGDIEDNSNIRIVDRPFYTPLRSRLQSLGDPIRGDLPIMCDENSNNGWFSVSKNPATDLRQGALFVLGGIDNKSTIDLYKLQQQYRGGLNNNFAGVNMGDMESQSQLRNLNQNTFTPDITARKDKFTNDILYTSFP